MKYDPVGLYLADRLRFSREVAEMRDRNRDRLREFRSRQKELAVVAIWVLGLSPLFGEPASIILACMGLLLIQVAASEARRMRATGRYWRTWMREPKAPEEIAFVEDHFVKRIRP